MQDLYALGFSTEKTGAENRKILQAAAEIGGDIWLTEPGEYPLEDTVVLKSDTALYFGSGVYICRTAQKGAEIGPVFLNQGAFTQTFDRRIQITGLKLRSNGIASTAVQIERTKSIPGIMAAVAFSYIQDLVIRDFETLDLPAANFAIQICTFENVLIENVRIEGLKDGLHFGRGRNFAVRHGLFRTFDDPIALNAHDYAISNPQLGWIENGVIEDCYDLNDDSTTGFFCRILAGSWVDWYEGMEIQNSDTVVANGRLYRAVLSTDGMVYRSFTKPQHEVGGAVLDGIRWEVFQDDVVYNAGCRNIHFKDIFLQKKRPTAFSIHFDNDCWSRSYYPDSAAPIQENLIFENIVCDNEIPEFLLAKTPVRGVKILNSTLCQTEVNLVNLHIKGLVYPETDILFLGNTFKGEGISVHCEPGRSAHVYDLANSGEVSLKEKDF